ncbi:MAG TPA: LysM domain-containing protein [Acidimicrobiales bacterium]|nr:LysM domain-containing protein [Acidimicrobiales bacterium]
MKAAAGVGLAVTALVALLAACGGDDSGSAAATTAAIITTTTTIATTTTATQVTYVIAKGDSLSKIAKKFNMTVEQLITINNIKDADHIEAGQVLIIVPAPPAATPTTTAPAPPPST